MIPNSAPAGPSMQPATLQLVVDEKFFCECGDPKQRPCGALDAAGDTTMVEEKYFCECARTWAWP